MLIDMVIHVHTSTCILPHVWGIFTVLTLSPPNKLSSANFSSAPKFKVLQCRSKFLKCCLSVKQLGPGWDAGLLGVSSRSKLFAYVTTVVLGGLRVKEHKKCEPKFWQFQIVIILKTSASSRSGDMILIYNYVYWQTASKLILQ